MLDLSPNGNLLLAANNDNGTVTVIDTKAKKALREIPVGHKPESVSWIGDGPLAAVSLYEDNQVVFFNTQSGKIVYRLKVSPEPYGLITDKAGKRAWVTHEYPGLVSEIDIATKKIVRQFPGGKHVRGIAISPNGKRLYTTEFFTGILHAIDLMSGKIVDSWKGHSTDNLARSVLIHPKRAKAYVPHIRSMVTVNHGAGSIFPQLAICDTKPGKGRRRVSFGMDTFNQVYVVTNPWEAAMSSDGKMLYVIYAGTNDMNVCNVVDDDYREILPNGRARRIGQNPRAIRLSPDDKTVYVYNTLDFSVGVYDANMRLLTSIKTCDFPKTPEWVRGKILFNTANYPMTSRRWIACSSCHPDGHHDGRVWQQPEGLRKTTALFGMAHTHPLHWSGDRDEAQDFEFTIRSQLMQGRGLMKGFIPRKVGYQKVELTKKTSGISKDLDAMAIYCNSFDVRLSPHVPAPGKLSESALRGKEIFFRKDVGCAKCHRGPYYTDSRLKKPFNLHDVGTGRDDKSEKMGTKYDTPSLLGIYRTGMYLHDGKAKSLMEVLTKYNPKDQHGKTSHLNKRHLSDLVSFLNSLPYDTPPNETANTVEFRVKMKNEK